MFLKRIITITTIILLFSCNIATVKVSMLRVEKYDTGKVIDPFEELMPLAINYLKEKEGFRSSPYKCSANQWTVGYGHGLIHNHRIESITEKDAEELLISDLKKRISIITKDVGESVEFCPNKIMALALFCFNVGEGNWRKSKLRSLVLSKQPIDEEIVKWRLIKGNVSTHLEGRRIFELKLYSKLL